MKNLPIGIQTFSKIIEENYLYVDKTNLMKLIKTMELDTTTLENKKISELVFDSYNLENLNVYALLFQTGYLTISSIVPKTRTIIYTLNYPNFEVKQAFMTYLLETFTENNLGEIQPAVENLLDYLETEDIEAFINIIRSLFAKIPYPLHIEQEAYYHSLFYMILVLMGVEIDLEVLTDKGRIDGILTFDDKIYLIEFKYGKVETQTKMDDLTKKALEQIKNKNYGERFLKESRPLIYLGVGFAGKQIGYKKVSSL